MSEEKLVRDEDAALRSARLRYRYFNKLEALDRGMEWAALAAGQVGQPASVVAEFVAMRARIRELLIASTDGSAASVAAELPGGVPGGCSA